MNKLIGGILGLLLIASCTNSVFLTNFIQAHHTEINYTYDEETGQVIVDNVYCFEMWGSSMNPTIFENNVVCFKNYTGEKLRQGNMVHYRTNGMEGLHRIEAVQADIVVVRGDNNRQEEIINYSNVKGILVLTLYK